MADYTQNTFFAPKDALPTNDPAKRIRGTEVDAEFSEIQSAISTKENQSSKNQVNGYAGLDGAGLLTRAQIPTATTTLSGAVRYATAQEAAALAAIDRALPPGVFTNAADAWLDAETSLVGKLHDLTDPNVTALVSYNPVTGLFGWYIPEASGGGFNPASVLIIAGTGLTGGGDLTFSRTLNVGQGDGIIVGSDEVALGLGNISNSLQGNALAANDLIPVYDTGTGNATIQYQNAGMPVDTVQGSKGLGSADCNRVQYCTGASAGSIVLDAGVGVVGAVIPIVQAGTGQMTVTGTATVNSANGKKTRAQHSVMVLMCVAANTWVLFGDTTP